MKGDKDSIKGLLGGPGRVLWELRIQSSGHSGAESEASVACCLV